MNDKNHTQNSDGVPGSDVHLNFQMNITKSLFDALITIFIINTALLNGALVKSSSTNSITSLNELPEGPLLLISQYLPCPQKELGFLSKYFRDLLFEKHRFGTILAERYKFLEFKNLQSHEIYFFFKNLAHIKDLAYLFESILTYLTNTSMAKNSDSKIFINFFGNLLNVLLTGNIEIFHESLNKIFLSNSINFLVNHEAYEQIVYISLFDRNPSKYAHIIESKNMSKIIQQIMHVDDNRYELMKIRFKDEEPFEISDASAKLFNYFLKIYFKGMNSFYMHSIISHVPESWFLAELEAAFVINPACFALIDLGSIDEDLKFKLHATFTTMIHRILNDNFDIRYYLFLYNIRFGCYIHCQYFVTECNELNLVFDKYENVVQAAFLANQNYIINYLYRYDRRRIENLVECEGYLIVTRLWESMSESEKQDSMADPTIFENFLAIYRVYKLNILVDNSHWIFQFSMKTDHLGIPDSFLYTWKLSLTNAFKIEMFIKKIIKEDLFIYEHHDYDSISNILSVLSQFEWTKNALTNISNGSKIYVSSGALEAISRNEDLLIMVKNLGIKFRFGLISNENREELFNNSVVNLVGILYIQNFVHFLSRFTSLKQFSYLEEFLGSESFSRVIEEFYYAAPNFFKHRLLLRYLLNHPNRNLLNQVRMNRSHFLEKFAAELDSEDLKLLHEV